MTDKPKVAIIDHNLNEKCPEASTLLVELFKKGIELTVAQTLYEFEHRSNLIDFPVLLFHPGTSEQRAIARITSDYPRLVIGLVSNNVTAYENRHVLNFFDYSEVSEIERFVRENQGGRT